MEGAPRSGRRWTASDRPAPEVLEQAYAGFLRAASSAGDHQPGVAFASRGEGFEAIGVGGVEQAGQARGSARARESPPAGCDPAPARRAAPRRASRGPGRSTRCRCTRGSRGRRSRPGRGERMPRPAPTRCARGSSRSRAAAGSVGRRRRRVPDPPLQAGPRHPVFGHAPSGGVEAGNGPDQGR